MADADTKSVTKTKIKVNNKVKPPKMYKVIYVNDEVTTVDFVKETLMLFFDYNSEDAEYITLDIHNNGSAVVAILPYELAEQKGIEVTTLARNNGFPLLIKLEQEA